METEAAGRPLDRSNEAGQPFRGFFDATAGMAPRPLLFEALQHVDNAGEALDLGCGAGNEVLELLQRGFSVTALDSSEEAIARVTARSAAQGFTRQLNLKRARFEVLRIAPSSADLIFAGFALPFCPPNASAGLWQQICAGLKEGGVFAGQLLGPNDDWAAGAAERGLTIHTTDDLERMVEGLELLHFEERDADGPVASGSTKRWHLFELIVRRPTSATVNLMDPPQAGGYCLAFVDGVELQERPEFLTVRSPLGAVRLERPSTGFCALLRLLQQGATQGELRAAVVEREGEEALEELEGCLQQLVEAALISHRLEADGAPLATLVPVSSRHRFQALRSDEETPYLLSRHALLRRQGAVMTLESPLSHAHLVLHPGPACSLVGELSEPRTLRDLSHKAPTLALNDIRRLLELLHNVGAVTPMSPDSRSEEAIDPSLLQWEFHDLLFHTRSRQSSVPTPFGATFHLKDRVDPLPAVKPPMSALTVDLHRPDLERLEREDPPFALVLEQRQSIRRYDARPMTVQQLGELLYRTARVRRMNSDHAMEMSDRPYPGAGSAYELELYLVVNACEGLLPGLHHYDPLGHRLEQLSGATPHTAALLRGAGAAAAEVCEPQQLLVITARFGRVFWKYQSMAYAAILKDVGVLQQTICLVATAMDLAPCALGYGNSETFTLAAGLEPREEAAVGELLLGSKPL